MTFNSSEVRAVFQLNLGVPGTKSSQKAGSPVIT
jgi:hypothetical protein